VNAIRHDDGYDLESLRSAIVAHIDGRESTLAPCLITVRRFNSGLSVTPEMARIEAISELVQLADITGLDLVARRRSQQFSAGRTSSRPARR
jgi:hypothetical protein